MPFPAQAVGWSDLKYPQDRLRLIFLSQPAKEAWYAAQNPQELAAGDREFQKFWSRCYGWHVKTKRFFYRFKFW